jgi:translation initiation factor IF-3
MIRIPQVRVVDEDGAQLGVMPTAQALALAQERGYDLVEVAPMAAPPVARFLDFGQYKYELTKKEKEAKRKQRSVTFKEVRLKPKIGIGDFDTKVRRAIEFLEEGDRIKVAVQFRGRELTHPEIGRALIERFSEKIKDHGVVERAPLLEGKSMHITVASIHKPKSHDAPGATVSAGVEAEAPATGPSGPADAEAAPRVAAAPVAEAPAIARPAAEPAVAVAVPAPASAPVPAGAPAAAKATARAKAAAEPNNVEPNNVEPAPAPVASAAPKPRPRTKAAAASVETPAPATTGE